MIKYKLQPTFELFIVRKYPIATPMLTITRSYSFSRYMPSWALVPSTLTLKTRGLTMEGLLGLKKYFKFLFIYRYYSDIGKNMELFAKSIIITQHMSESFFLFFKKPINFGAIFSQKKVREKLSLNASKNNFFKLHFTFVKRNIFFNLATFKGNTLYYTTTRRQGYLGRRRLEYASVFSSTRAVKNIAQKYNIKKIALIYKGWHRFRVGVDSALVNDDGQVLSVNYIKYVIKIPHNGSRKKKKKGISSASRWYKKNIYIG